VNGPLQEQEQERLPAGHGGLLRNMSARPRTPIRREIPAIGVPALGNRWLLLRPRRPGKPVSLKAKDVGRLEQQWQQLGLTGAVLLHPATVARQPGVETIVCADADLTLNVLLRARGRLLLAGSPLIVDTYGQPVGEFACDDPRLLAAAGPGAAR